MKPVTQARVARILTRVSPYLTTGQLAALAEIVEYELECQDRDTRHACADAVNALPTYGGGLCIGKDAAFSACMNTQAV